MWDLKRDLYFTLANGFHGMSNDLCRLQDSGYPTREDTTKEDEQLIAINKVITQCSSLIAQAWIVLNDDAVDALMKFESEVNRLTSQASGRPDASYCEGLNDAVKDARESVIRGAKIELMPPEIVGEPSMAVRET